MLFADVQNASKHALSVLGVNCTGWKVEMVKFTGALSILPCRVCRSKHHKIKVKLPLYSMA